MVLLRNSSYLFIILATIFCTELLSGMALIPAAHAIVSTQEPGSVTAGQSEPDLPRFEVVSIKQNLDPDEHFNLRFTPDGFTARNCRLRTLIVVAFHLKDDRLLVNLPHDKEAFYDIEAKVGEGDMARFKQLSDVQKMPMLKSLLTERFQLKYHSLSRELPVYALVIDKKGSKLADAKPNANGKIEKSMQVTGRYTIVATGLRMEDFFEFLSEVSGRYVVDRTGLSGRYDFTLSCAPDPSTDSREDVTWDGPVIFTALREELGLALEPSTAMLDAIAIDHVEAPTPN
jgi:uncharacterized protein (TIGR03435 family)